MARKMNLAKTRKTFVDVLVNGDAAWQSSQAAPVDRRKTVAEDIFLRHVVGWETFVFDWFIGCINHDASRYRQAVERRMNNWLQAEVKNSYGMKIPCFINRVLSVVVNLTLFEPSCSIDLKAEAGYLALHQVGETR